MKKMISFILAAALTAVAAMPAFAADTVSNGDGTWTTSGSDASYANKMMTMVAYEGDGEITVDSIQYIDQTVANGSGAFAFENYIPKDLPTAGDYTVLVGGETLDAPIAGGTIAKIETPEVAVAGKVITLADVVVAKVDFLAAGTEDVIASADVAAGAFSVDVAPGTYDVLITSVGYLSYKITGVVVETAMTLADCTLAAGDVDPNGVVNVTDLSNFLPALAKLEGGEGYVIACDFDANGAINATDLANLVKNLSAQATVVPFQ